MTTMKALVTIEGKKAAVQSVDVPNPGEGEILVKVVYVAQNPTDWKGVPSVPPGRIVGCDFAGTIADANGSHWRKGQRVAGFVQGNSANPLRGAFAEYLVIEASLVYEIPSSVSWQDAAVIPLAFATAAQALYQRLKLPQPHEKAKSAFPVLINGGTGSVGKYAVQLAKLSGLFVIATGSKRNHELLLQLGADVTVDYNDDDWIEQIKKHSHDRLEHAFDTIAEISTTSAIAKAISPEKGGHIVTILPRKQDDIDPSLKQVKVESTIVYTVFERPIKYGAFDNCGDPTPKDKAFWEKWLTIIPGLLEKKELKPNRVKEMGGIDDILTGFKVQEEGKVSAEKLVYKISDA